MLVRLKCVAFCLALEKHPQHKIHLQHKVAVTHFARNYEAIAPPRKRKKKKERMSVNHFISAMHEAFFVCIWLIFHDR